MFIGITILATAAHAAPLSRSADPVVLKGEDLPMFKGTAPDSLVAFRYEDGWVQIPVQVDERDVRSYGVVYDFADHWSLNGDTQQGKLYPFLEEFYTDPGTYMGPDTDPMLDDNDEVVFMVKDTGNKAPAIADPPGVVPGSGFEVQVSDPLDGATGYVYLFQNAGGLDPSAGQSYVDYQFKLESGAYLGTFRLVGINLELSTVSSEYYERTFTSRLLSEVLRITAPGASGVDILDRYKYRVATPFNCGQVTEEIIERHEGAFVANKSGPVRGIRSHMGFRSGPAFRHDYFFYEQREDMVLHWLGHGLDEDFHVFADYAPAAIGMTYFNNNNTGGVVIDGDSDSVNRGVLQWELVSGSPGSLVMIHDLVSSFSFLRASSYYLDDDSPAQRQCAGDAFAIGSSGQTIRGVIPDTDPRTSSDTIAWVSSRYYGSPGRTVTEAEQLRAFSENPLVTTISDTPVNVTFNEIPRTLTVNKTGAGTITSNPGGIDCGGTCTASFVSGTIVTLTATPAAGSVFGGWSGGVCSGTGICMLTIDANTSVTATFNASDQMFTLEVMTRGSANGTVTSGPAGINCGSDCSQVYAINSSIVLTAAPMPGASFKQWSGACTGGGTCTVTMSADRSVTATYSKTFTDDPLTAKVTLVKAVHYLETLEGINFLGQRHGLGTISFSTPIPAAGVPISAKDMITLQTGLNRIYDALGRSRPIFDSIVSGVTVIGKSQMDQIRNAIRAVESLSTN